MIIGVASLFVGVGLTLLAGQTSDAGFFLAAAVAMLALYPLSRWKKYGEPIPRDEIPERPGMVETPVSEQKEAAPVMSLSMSFLPYAVLTAVTLGVLLIPALNNIMRQVQVGRQVPPTLSLT